MRFETDPELLRPVDVPVLRGDHARLTKATGWEPEIPLAQTLTDLLDDWRTRIAGLAPFRDLVTAMCGETGPENVSRPGDAVDARRPAVVVGDDPSGGSAGPPEPVGTRGRRSR